MTSESIPASCFADTCFAQRRPPKRRSTAWKRAGIRRSTASSRSFAETEEEPRNAHRQHRCKNSAWSRILRLWFERLSAFHPGPATAGAGDDVHANARRDPLLRRHLLGAGLGRRATARQPLCAVG